MLLTRGCCLFVLCVILVLYSGRVHGKRSPAQIRELINNHNVHGSHSSIISLSEQTIKEYGSLDIDDEYPSLYSYYGVALHYSQRTDDAIDAFKRVVVRFVNDTRSWINLGEQYGQVFRIAEAFEVYSIALEKGDISALPRLMRIMAWGGIWKDFDKVVSTIEKEAKKCHEDEYKSKCVIDSASGFEYTDLPGYITKYLEMYNPNSRSSPFKVDLNKIAGLWTDMVGGARYVKPKPVLPSAAAGAAASSTAAFSLPAKKPEKKESKFKFLNNIINKRILNNVVPTATDTPARQQVKSSPAVPEPVHVPVRDPNSAAVSPTGVKRRLKIGVISSDFGVHPVATLFRGVLQYLNDNHNLELEIFAFSVKSEMSWWGHNISGTIEHFVPLYLYRNTQDAAAAIAATGVEILIDLNGHTKDSGLPILSHRPAPIQMTFLGLPTTSGSAFIDFIIGDRVSNPGEQVDQYVEKLALMQNCYISNDYAALRGKVLDLTGRLRCPRENLTSSIDLTYIQPVSPEAPKNTNKPARFLLGTLSNFQKINPDIFHVWMNIMRRFPSSVFAMVAFEGSHIALDWSKNYTKMYGIKETRVGGTKQAPWFNHIMQKTAFDLLFDTMSKNGHTTGLDAVWGGVPLVSLAGGSSMSKRASESIATALEVDYDLLSYSLKEYEDLAYDLLKNERKMRLVREQMERARSTSRLFDTAAWTREFANLLEASWDSVHIALNKTTVPVPSIFANDNAVVTPKYHIFASSERNPRHRPMKAVSVRQSDDMGFDIGGDYRQVHGDLHIVSELNKKKSARAQQKYRNMAKHRSKRAATGESSPEGDSGVGGNPVLRRQKMRQLEEQRQKAATSSGSSGVTSAQQQTSEPSSTSSFSTLFEYAPIPDEVYDAEYIMLNIGGTKKAPGWFNVNAQAQSFGGAASQRGEVQIFRQMDDLVGIEDSTVAAVYSSHTLEHASFGDGKMAKTLAGKYLCVMCGVCCCVRGVLWCDASYVVCLLICMLIY